MKYFLLKLSIYLFIPIVLLFHSCGEKTLAKAEISFEDHVWKNNPMPELVLDVQANNRPWQLKLWLRFNAALPISKIPIRIYEISPDESELIIDRDITLRNDKGELLGDKGLDIVDLEVILDNQRNYAAFGKYKYRLEHRVESVDELPGIMDIGLSIIDVKPS
jgi:gliding motility-associated lipoprotein GldH